MAENRIEFNAEAWNELLTGVVNSWARPKAETIAAAANQGILASDNLPSASTEGLRDYMVSTEGSDPLNKGEYRATVITVTNRAKADNARRNTLIRLMGGGA